MCYYIVATLPAKVHISALRPAAESHALHFSQIKIPSLTSYLPEGDRCFLFTRNYCDCEVVMGARRELAGDDDSDKEIAEEAETLRHKGWSNAKIERWVNDKKAAADRHRIERSVVDYYKRYNAFLQQVVGERLTPHFGLVLHFYSGALSKEEITIRKTVPLRIDHVLPVTLMSLEDDIFYLIQPS